MTTTTAPTEKKSSDPVLPLSSAQEIAWDLGDLYQGLADPKIEQDLAQAKQRAERFEQTYRGLLQAPEGPAPEPLQQALTELEALSEQMDKPLIFAMLMHSAQTNDPSRGALLAKTREARTAINQHLIFFDLAWVALPDAVAQPLIEHPLLARFRHYLEQKRLWKPHYLSEPEEKILEEKQVTGRAAFVRLFDETTALMTCPFEGKNGVEKLTIQQTLAKLYDPDAAVRQAASNALTASLKDQSRLLTFLFNTVILDHQVDVRLRRFANPMEPRNLANEISAATVHALMTSIEAYHGTVQRYYRMKAKLMGLPVLHDHDRYAPVFADLPRCPWDEAAALVRESYRQFSPQAGQIIDQFFERRWIDADPRPGKRGGAFSSSAVPSAHPYILMNYTDKLRDVMTLAHELGHGLHQYLSRNVGYLQCDTPLTTAETASVFGEMLTFERLLDRYPEPRIRLGLLCGKIEDSFATAFRQVVMTRFEEAAHQARQEKGELATEQLNDLWIQANLPMHGQAVTLTPNYAWWWLYVGHFIHVPFYCYAYSFGELLVLALVQKYKQEGTAFVEQYLDLLRRGGSESPPQLLRRLGVDINDPGFWKLGLRLLDDMVTQAEQLAAQI